MAQTAWRPCPAAPHAAHTTPVHAHHKHANTTTTSSSSSRFVRYIAGGLAAAVVLLLLLQQAALHTADATAASAAAQISSSSTGSSSSSATQHDAQQHLALLDTLWSATPFAPGIIHHHQQHQGSSSGNDSSSLPLHPAVTKASAATTREAVDDCGGGGGTDAAALRAAAARSGASVPRLLNPADARLSTLQHLAAVALAPAGALPEAAAREAYAAAFAAVPPPPGLPPWQVKLPTQLAAEAAAAHAATQQQHMGAQFVDASSAEGSSSAGGPATRADPSAPGPAAAEGSGGDAADDDDSHVPLDVLKALPQAAQAAAISGQAAAAAAAAALLQQQQQRRRGDAPAAAGHAARLAAQHLANGALLLALSSGGAVAPCGVDDASLPYQIVPPGHAPHKTLLAVTLLPQDRPDLLPNLVLQLLQFVLQAPAGSLYISISMPAQQEQQPDAAVWVDLLQLLMAPLQVPVLVVHHSAGSTSGLTHSQAAAAARNAAIEAFFGAADTSECPGQADGGADDGADGANPDDELQEPEDRLAQLSDMLHQQRQHQQQQQWRRRRRARRNLHSSKAAGDTSASGILDASAAAATSDKHASGSGAVSGPARVPSSASAPSPSSSGLDSPACFHPDWLVFIDASVLWCKQDLQRLLMHSSADLACGMDMHVAAPSPPRPPANGAAAAAAGQQQYVQPTPSSTLRRRLQQAAGSRAAAGGAGNHMHYEQHAQLQLQLRQRQRQQQQMVAASPYAAAVLAAQHAVAERPPSLDLWRHPLVYTGASVGRMVNGEPFSAAPFFASGHAPTLRRLVAGLPAQAYCCWSGLAKVNAEPFRRGLVLRAGAPAAPGSGGECGSSSSTGALCDDLHRLGFSRVLVDAGVLLAHDFNTSLKLTPLVRAADRAPYVRRSRWVEADGSGFAWQADPVALRHMQSAVQCCASEPLGDRTGPLPWQEGGSGGGNDGSTGPLTVEELVQAAGAGRRAGGPLPALRGWDAAGCRPVDVMARNHTAVFLHSLQRPVHS